MFKAIKQFLNSKRGGVEGIFKTIVLAAVLLPTAIGIFVSTSTTGWNQMAATVWGFIPVIAVVAVLYLFIKYLRE